MTRTFLLPATPLSTRVLIAVWEMALSLQVGNGNAIRLFEEGIKESALVYGVSLEIGLGNGIFGGC